MKIAKALILCLIIAVPVFAATSIFEIRGVTGSTTSDATRVNGGLYVVLFYIPDAGVASDPCGVAGGAFGGGTMTLQYSPDDDVSFYNVTEPALVGATVPVESALQVGDKFEFRLVTSAVTCVSFSMRRSE